MNNTKLFVRAVVVWLVIIAMESLQGTLRVLFLAPVVGELRARQIGVLTGSAVIILIACAFSGWLKSQDDDRNLVAIGVYWLVLTLVFELGLGHFVLARSWKSLMEDYDVAKGGLLPAGLLVLTFAPYIAARLRRS